MTISLVRADSIVASECVQQMASFDGVAITTQTGDAGPYRLHSGTLGVVQLIKNLETCCFKEKEEKRRRGRTRGKGYVCISSTVLNSHGFTHLKKRHPSFQEQACIDRSLIFIRPYSLCCRGSTAWRRRQRGQERDRREKTPGVNSEYEAAEGAQ